MKENAFIWVLKRIRSRIPAVGCLIAAEAGYALFSVFFALGSRGVIDSAVLGDPQAFRQACLNQGCIIGGILICLTIARHLRDRLAADLERDWKQKLLHGLLHGDYAAVSRYHSAELLNRLNNDVTKVNSGVLSILPSFASMATRLTAAVVVLGVLDARFTVLIGALGIVVVVGTSLMRRRRCPCAIGGWKFWTERFGRSGWIPGRWKRKNNFVTTEDRRKPVLFRWMKMG